MTHYVKRATKHILERGIARTNISYVWELLGGTGTRMGRQAVLEESRFQKRADARDQRSLSCAEEFGLYPVNNGILW